MKMKPITLTLISGLMLALSFQLDCLADGAAGMNYYKNAAADALQKHDLESAEKLMLKLRMKTRLMKTGTAEAADAFASLAELFADKGRSDDMKLCLKEAIRLREQTDGQGSTAVITLQSRLAKRLHEQNKNAESLDILENCMLQGKTLSGQYNPALESVFAQMGVMCGERGQFKKAKDYGLLAYDLCKKRADYETNKDAPEYLLSISYYCNGLGEFLQSEQYARESSRLAQKVYDIKDLHRAIDMSNLAVILEAQKKKDEAQNLIKQLWKEYGSPNDEEMAKACYTVGYRFTLDGYYKDAEPFLAAASKTFLKVKGSDDTHTMEAICNLAQALGSHNDIAGAEKALTQISFSKTGTTKFSGNPLFNCNHEFARVRKYFYSKGQYQLALKVGMKQLEFLISPIACKSCAHLCLPDCYKELAQTSIALGDQKNAAKYSNCLAELKGPAPVMK
ncbi:MAG: hypothetical protein K2X81_01425 [Candidatus Obscuribacterales bacterium]|nr:hypothetical protein [Candidatus Obscuribacterales bacterium]